MKTLLVFVLLSSTTLAGSLHQESLSDLSRLLSDPERLYGPAIMTSRSFIQCYADITHYVDSLKNLSDWALYMFDASTKVPEGVFMGNLAQLGNYDECLNVTDVPSSRGTFDGQHCLTTLTVLPKTKENSGTYQNLMKAQSLSRSSISINMGEVTDNLAGLIVQVALCIPSTCSAKDLENVVNIALKPSLPNVLAKVNPDQCHTLKNGHRLRVIDLFAIGFLAVFVVIAAASTLYDVRCRKNDVKGKPLLVSFSVYSNWLRLISISTSSETLSAVNGIRFISMAWVVLGHRYLTVAGLPSVNLVYLNEFKKNWSRLTIMNGTLSVDTFFLLSGLLTAYVFLREMEKRNSFNIFLYYIHRYIRLTPALGVMILLTATLLNYAGEGPLWDSRNRNYREACEKNWWSNLIYINNYYDSGKMCLGQTWYLAVDMQLHWLSPLILIPLWKAPRLSQVLLIVLMIGGLATAFTVPYVEEFWAGLWTGPEELRPVSQQNNYYPTHTRFMPWIIGIGVGYWLRRAKKMKLKLTKVQVALGWIMSTFLMLGAMHLAFPFQQPGYEYDRLESSLYISLFRPAWSLGVAWIIIACDLGYGGLPNTILSWGVFQPLGRLSYGIYLTHVSVLVVESAGIKTPIYLADVNTIPQFMGDLLMSIGWSIPLILLFESPVILIEKTLLGPKDTRRQEDAGDVQTTEAHQTAQRTGKGGV